MNALKLEQEIQRFDYQWHKLLFLCNVRSIDDFSFDLDAKFEVINVNLILSECLLCIPSKKYSLYVEESIQKIVWDDSKIYVLHHIEILFDLVLQTHPIRLLENISKRNRVIIIWPGVYEEGTLIYGEIGHPEYFRCSNFEGNVIEIMA